MRSALWLAVGCAALGLGCAAKVGVEFDTAEDFASYERWEWLKRPRPLVTVVGASSKGLHDLIEGEIERALAARGFVRARDGESPDFFVTYHGQIERELEIATTRGASRYVASMHTTPSYVVSGPEKTVQIYDRSRLVMDVADGRDQQLVWRGSWDMRVRGDFRGQVAGAVDRILDRFPPDASGG